VITIVDYLSQDFNHVATQLPVLEQFEIFWVKGQLQALILFDKIGPDMLLLSYSRLMRAVGGVTLK